MFCVTTRKHLGLLLVLSCWAVVNTGVSSLDAADHLYQKAQYQMRELEKTLRELETSHNIKKRSTGVSEKCVDLVRLVQQMCHNEDTGTTTITMTNDVRPKTKTNTIKMVGDNESDKQFEYLEFYGNATLPDIIMRKATAKRDRANLEVEFELIHSFKIYVMQVRSLESQKKFMESTEELGERFGNVQLKLSRVSLNFDTSMCSYEEFTASRQEANLLIASDDSRSYVNVMVDVCKYDKVLNENEDWQNMTDIGQGVRSQDFEVPKLKFLSDPGDTIFIERGQNPSFEIEIRLTSKNIMCSFSYNLYDWQSNKYESNMMIVEQSESNETGLEIRNAGYHKTNNLLAVDVLRVTVRNYEESSDSDDINVDTHEKYRKRMVKQVDAKVRVTVDIGSRELSGRLYIDYNWMETDWQKRHIIRDLGTHWSILLRLPYKINEMPPNSAEIRVLSTQCDKNGNRNGYNYGKNCTIECFAWGADIKSIFIIKSPYRFPVKSSTYVIKNINAYAIQDVGAVSEDVEGDYRCTVVLENGKTKSKDMFLATTGFTDVTNFTLEDLGNSTARLVCTVYGFPPLNISITIYDDEWREERLDNKTGVVRSVETFENLTTLTLLICTDELQYPKEDVMCEASGIRGSGNMDVRPRNFLNTYNPFIPKLIKENSTVVKGGGSDLTTTIFCLATSGGKPVDMMVAYGGQGRRFRIDHNPGNILKQQETDEGTLLTLTVPTRSIERPTSWLYCGTENEFGEDWMEFYLPDYGVDD